MVKVGVLGYGTVGSGVVEILEKNKDIIAKRVGVMDGNIDPFINAYLAWITKTNH